MRSFSATGQKAIPNPYLDFLSSEKFKHFWIYTLVAVLFSSNIMLAIALYKSPKIADALSSKSAIQLAAYENRIAHLRTELDRLQSRQYAKSGDINLQLQELAAQQELLIEQHDYVKSLAEKAKSLGLDVKTKKSAALRTNALPLITGTDQTDISNASESILEMQEESLSALNAIAQSADSSADIITNELKRAGLTIKAQPATGGPYLSPRPDMEYTDHVDAANAAIGALTRFQSAKQAVQSAPIHRPLAKKYRFSSRFGNRRDPFTGKSAFHSGLDFAAPKGTSVKAVGSGKVTFAGTKGGYGNAVEITHPSGLVSRYAHLSVIRVSKGQTVTANSTIGLVGSTGRSTGAHLHLEVRQNDKPINPDRFLTAGAKLAKFLN
ncbi:M23 family metallopeptidase [Maritalea porphyrae]|uniref:M23 family metallopeptidase n=1 Tax=Maritalea porphyrae TaxID=880732 RepID=UPI0022B0490A|nr:M23 family metallopeptidase [Maritalea porphyrae]MCZ4272972.1 M23 family metallopeptidase [Maritalea porphyrae]